MPKLVSSHCLFGMFGSVQPSKVRHEICGKVIGHASALHDKRIAHDSNVIGGVHAAIVVNADLRNS